MTASLNDVDMEAVAGLAGKIQQEPEVAATQWNATVNWKGGFRSEAKIRDFEPAVSDEPGGLGGTDTGPNPVEQVLAALGNCLAVGYAANATAAGIKLSDLTIELEEISTCTRFSASARPMRATTASPSRSTSTATHLARNSKPCMTRWSAPRPSGTRCLVPCRSVSTWRSRS